MSNKHEVNVRKSSWLNFQIGLIASLMFTYVMFEVYTTEIPIVEPPEQPVIDDSFVWDGNFQVYKEPEPKEQAVIKKPVQPVTPVVDPNKFKVVKNNTKVNNRSEFKNNTPAAQPSVTVFPTIPKTSKSENTSVKDFTKVEEVPVFPGCEYLETNEERAACFSEKISRVVSRKFDTSLAGDLGLKGTQRIYVQFEVYKDGTIQNIQARATHPLLEKEAIRVVERFPKMTPGRQGKQNVTVKYQLPIAFKIQD